MNDEVEFTDDATALYRLYDVNGCLLYVGITFGPAQRMGQHAADQPWWDEVVRKTMVWYPSRADASDAETIAIQTESPRYNKLQSSGPGVRRRSHDESTYESGMPEGWYLPNSGGPVPLPGTGKRRFTGLSGS